MSEAVPYAITPHTVELILTLGTLVPRGGPVQNPVHTQCASRPHPEKAVFLSFDGTEFYFTKSLILLVTGIRVVKLMASE